MPGDDHTDRGEDRFDGDDDDLAGLFPYDTGEFQALADDDLDDLLGPPLPLEDRIWRHPSELRFDVPPDPEPAIVERSTSRRSLVLVGVGGGLLGALLVLGLSQILVSTPVERIVERRIESAGATLALTGPRAGADIVEVAEAVLPAIVRISVREDQIEVGSGSGVVFRSDGHLLTNAHVVGAGDDLVVELADGRVFRGTLIGADPRTDVAVVDIDAQDLEVAALGTADDLSVGQWAVAIGSPLGLAGGPTVTLGVISAVGRELTTLEGGRLYDLIQTDAPIAPGSSGGALVDTGGGVVGITTAVAVSERGVEGLGFATPIDVAYSIATDLIEHGEARHAWLGIRGTAREPRRDGDRPSGVEVHEVVAGGPAESAGVVEGDVIAAVDGSAVSTMSELITALRRRSPGDAVLLTLERDGELRDQAVLLGERDAVDDELPSSTTLPG